MKLICRKVTLAYFKPGDNTILPVDASGRGLWCRRVSLSHSRQNHPVRRNTRTLSDNERERERDMLAVIFGCERFHAYVCGTRFTIESDHKPLEMTILKNSAEAPHILQRMMPHIQAYDFQIRYRPGKEMALADMLFCQPCSDNKNIEVDVQVSHV